MTIARTYAEVAAASTRGGFALSSGTAVQVPLPRAVSGPVRNQSADRLEEGLVHLMRLPRRRGGSAAS